MPTRPGDGSQTSLDRPLKRELRALCHRPLQPAMALAVLVNAVTFCSFTYLAVIATGPAGLAEAHVPLLPAVVGASSFCGVILAGRYADAHSTRLISMSGPALVMGWGLFTLTAGYPGAVWSLALPLGTVPFALGTTVITRILVSAREAPTMGGSPSRVKAIGHLLSGLSPEAGRRSGGLSRTAGADHGPDALPPLTGHVSRETSMPSVTATPHVSSALREPVGGALSGNPSSADPSRANHD